MQAFAGSGTDADLKRLAKLNAAGAGVFLTVSEMDGPRRGKAHLKHIRAVWCEADSPGERTFPLPPSITVKTSPVKRHYYWVLADDMTVEQFHGVMDCMVADHGSDPNARDVARVLRLPGFYHRKGSPHLVQVTEWGTNDAGELLTYTAAELVAAFPATTAPANSSAERAAKPSNNATSSVGGLGGSDRWDHLASNIVKPEKVGLEVQLAAQGHLGPFEVVSSNASNILDILHLDGATERHAPTPFIDCANRPTLDVGVRRACTVLLLRIDVGKPELVGSRRVVDACDPAVIIGIVLDAIVGRQVGHAKTERTPTEVGACIPHLEVVIERGGSCLVFEPRVCRLVSFLVRQLSRDHGECRPSDERPCLTQSSLVLRS